MIYICLYMVMLLLSVRIIAGAILDRYITVGDLLMAVPPIVQPLSCLISHTAYIVSLAIAAVVDISIMAAATNQPVYRIMYPLLRRAAYDGR